ncbi:hypothetical protein TrRE_jg11470 [Triparma retinervis]|uniref:C3H1-type domain-containing protein n=1 Tax=Triparma retinervis TaxID=2557542 RepID=A0A9W6ZXX9_9STRA|nr:hypothetical protein TrRE_jg11470 [Triparma retinervis]
MFRDPSSPFFDDFKLNEGYRVDACYIIPSIDDEDGSNSESHDPFWLPLQYKSHSLASSLAPGSPFLPFCCLLPHCASKFELPKARDSHMVAVHGYPKGYRFHSASAARRIRDRRGGCRMGDKCKYRHGGGGGEDVDKGGEKDKETGEVANMEVDVDDLCEGVGKMMRKVPTNISFGRRKKHGPKLQI